MKFITTVDLEDGEELVVNLSHVVYAQPTTLNTNPKDQPTTWLSLANGGRFFTNMLWSEFRKIGIHEVTVEPKESP